MGTAEPEACHNIPWASCESACLLSLAATLIPSNADNNPNLRYFIESPGVSDNTWNMISLLAGAFVLLQVVVRKEQLDKVVVRKERRGRRGPARLRPLRKTCRIPGIPGKVEIM